MSKTSILFKCNPQHHLRWCKLQQIYWCKNCETKFFIDYKKRKLSFKDHYGVVDESAYVMWENLPSELHEEYDGNV